MILHNNTLYRYAELGSFSSLKFRINKRSYCDEIVDQSTIFIKLDAVVNIYHHFCDFFNLYASQHINGSFSDDVQIVIWDTVTVSTVCVCVCVCVCVVHLYVANVLV